MAKNIRLGKEQYIYTTKEGIERVQCSFDYAWGKLHYLHKWLVLNNARRVIPLEYDDYSYYGTLRGWSALRELVNCVEYHCRLYGVVCEAYHEALKGREGEYVHGMTDSGCVASGIVSPVGSQFIRYYALIKQGLKRGHVCYPWVSLHLIEEIDTTPRE